MKGLCIVGTGSCLPRTVVTNRDMERRVDTSDEWIVSRTGIRERRFAGQGEDLTALAGTAARRAMEAAGIGPEQVGLCLVATVTPDRLTPAQACLLHRELGLAEDCPAFDVSAGCTGFLYALETAAALLPRLGRPFALVIGGEVLSRIVDMEDRNTCILFGDGAGAVVARSSDGPWACSLHARGDRELLWAEGPGQGGPHLRMDGQGVFRFALETVPRAARELLDRAGLEAGQVDWFLPHQANHRIVDGIARRLHVPLERFYENMDRYGNTSAASIPIALDEMARQGLLKEGQWIMCLGFGAGLTWAGLLFRWGQKKEEQR